MTNAIKPVILCGGSGTRLWPLSREQYPKQLLSIYGDESLLQATTRRASGLPGISGIEYICNEQYRFLIAEQVREVHDDDHAIVLEPCGRNTAPAIALAAFRAQAEDAVLLVMPSDHIIADDAGFAASVASGVELAKQGKLVTFGVKASRPETGYGYIEVGDAVTDGFDVKQFVEKPDEKTAAVYVASGDYFWNAGIFMFLASSYLAELQTFEPEVYEHCKAAADNTEDDLDFVRVAMDLYENCPSISIDYAVMERTTNAVVVPLDAGWTDVGTFDALWAAVDKDSDGNAVVGDVLHHDTANSYLRAEHRLLTTIGVEDLVVIETSDAVLVANKTSSQDIKILVNKLHELDRSEGQEHRRVYRPWGYYEGIDSADRYQVKMIEVNPGASLSLQMHHHRAEHWIVVTGTARVTKGEEVFQLAENESTYIPIGTTHRLENPGKIPLRIIEVQSGSYLGEDDIVRFEDNYGRKE